MPLLGLKNSFRGTQENENLVMLLLHIQRTFLRLSSGEASLGRSKKVSKLNHNVILLVGMVDSPHFQKWVHTLKEELTDKDIFIFPSDRPRLLRNKEVTIQKRIARVKVFQLVPARKLNFALYYLLDLLFLQRWRAYFLAKVILRRKPNIIHFHEMQHSAYLFNLIATHSKVPKNIKLIVSTWGSDLTLYSWADKHIAQIQSVLSWTDVLTAEKESEQIDARRLGFTAGFLSPVYITLGKSKDEIKDYPITSSRRIVLVKGYQDNPGRALNALQALEGLQNELNEFEIIVYSASEPVRLQVNLLRNKYAMNIKVLERVSHQEMQNIFSQARVSISLAVSDGLPGVLVEAMASGTFPIQSANSAAKDLIQNGVGGFIVDPWDLNSVADSIRIALTDDHLVDTAQKINKDSLEKNYSLADGILRLRELYS
jgi:glycosyltransferase involved in cell wall biosynthesis